MKSLTQKEILELIKAKKLAPESLHAVSDYKEDEVLLAEAINKLSSTNEKAYEMLYKQNKEIKEVIALLYENLTKIVNMRIPEVKVTMPEHKPEEWDFDIIRNSSGFIASVKAKEVSYQ